MVATTFSTDTPNLVTNFVRTGGVAANWSWWAFLLTGMATVFFYARVWRRSGVLTDLEFYEIRYSGRPATFVRGFRALYLGLFFNCVIMASVNLAAAKIANVLLGWPMSQTLLICAALNVAFAATSGLWGVLVTDFIQFGIAMTGSVAAAVYAVRQPQVGGLVALFAKSDVKVLALLPDFGDWSTALAVLIIPITVQWWAVWYPGAEPGGGSYIAQRMLAAKSEKDALGAVLFFNVAHYVLRPWPWILVALASILVYPQLSDIQAAFPHLDPKLLGHDIAYPAMLKFLPIGFVGLMVGGLVAANSSTILTHLNWGASYLVHDFYRRFIKRGAPEHHYVQAGRLGTVMLFLLSSATVFALDTAQGSFNVILQIGAGTGLLYLVRWFWWRVTAWCEIAAMISSFAVSIFFLILVKRGSAPGTAKQLLITIAVTTVCWLITAYVSPATERDVLIRFYTLVRPAGPGWARVRRDAGLPADSRTSPDNIPMALLGWVAGCAAIWSALFAVGNLLYYRFVSFTICTVVFVISGIVLIKVVQALWSG